jgi:IMP dehydrogenase
MRVEAIMQWAVCAVGPGTSVRAAAALMRERDVGLLPVVEAGRPIGVVTDRDLALGLLPEALWAAERPVAGLMSRVVWTCRADETALDIARRMGERQVRRLAVVDAAGRLTGIVSLGDIARDASETLAGQALGEIVERRDRWGVTPGPA